MLKIAHLIQFLLATSIVAHAPSYAAEPKSANDSDPVRATLIESKEKARGVTIYSNGASISMVVTALDERYAIGRSQQSTRVVVRIDRIDGISTAF